MSFRRTAEFRFIVDRLARLSELDSYGDVVSMNVCMGEIVGALKEIETTPEFNALLTTMPLQKAKDTVWLAATKME